MLIAHDASLCDITARMPSLNRDRACPQTDALAGRFADFELDGKVFYGRKRFALPALSARTALLILSIVKKAMH